MLISDLCNYSDVYIALKERISVRGTNNPNRINENIIFNLRIMLHLDHAYQKLITHLWMLQKIFILLCGCTIVLTKTRN